MRGEGGRSGERGGGGGRCQRITTRTSDVKAHVTLGLRASTLQMTRKNCSRVDLIKCGTLSVGERDGWERGESKRRGWGTEWKDQTSDCHVDMARNTE